MLKVIELFAGVGTQNQALKNIGVNFEIVGISEIDKFAISSYFQLHPEVDKKLNLGDICKIKKLPKADLWTYSFPCQDLSTAGRQQGIKKGTRSGLLLEVERLLDVSSKDKELPKYLLLENVKNLVGKNFKPDFDKWLYKLETLGYTNYWQVLNAKDYGIPQNRERVFVVSILGKHETYEFPKPKELNLKLKDMLEDKVDEKYYLSNSMINCFTETNKNESNFPRRERFLQNITRKRQDIANAITTRAGSRVTDNFIIDNIEDLLPKSYKRNFGSKGKIQNVEAICSTLQAAMGGGGGNVSIFLDKLSGRIRKLTARECWRLMGWKDEQFNKLSNISDTQLYKQAGNGIVVNVLEEIFKNLLLK